TRQDDHHRQERYRTFDHHQHFGATHEREGIGGTECRGRVVSKIEIVEEERAPVGRQVLGFRRLRKDPIRLCAQIARPNGRPPPSICQYSKEKVRTLATQMATEEVSNDNGLTLPGWSVTMRTISTGCTIVLAT